MSSATRKPVGVEELKNAMQEAIVERFGDRTLDRKTVERATAQLRGQAGGVVGWALLDHPGP